MEDSATLPDVSDETTRTKSLTVTYTPERGEALLERYIEGMSLVDIAALPGSPSYGTLLRWLKDSKKLASQFEAARAVRAINLEEKALALANGEIDKDQAPGKRLQFDILKWGAEVHDPSRFGKKLTVAGDPDKPVVFKFVTGVPAPNPSQLPPLLDAKGMAIKTEIAVESVPVPEESTTVVEESTQPKSLLESLTENPYEPGIGAPEQDHA